MAAAFVQAWSAAENGNNPTLDVTINPTAGNLLIVAAFGLTPGVGITVADGVSTYTPISAEVGSSANGRAFYAENVTGGSRTLTLTFATDSPYSRIYVHEVSGAATSGSLDKHAESTTPTTGSGSQTTTTNGQYIFGACYTGNSATAYTAGSGFGPIRAHNEDTVASATEDQVQSSAGSIAVTFGAGDNDGICLMATFKAAAGGAYDQEGYRWRNDDGSETTATWKAAQDTSANVAVSTNVRLRVLIDRTG